MLPVLVRLAWAPCATLNCATPPYTAPKLNAACFRAKGVGVLGDALLCYPRRPGYMLPVLVRWVQMYLYCAPPPVLRLGSALPVFGPFYCSSCGR